MKLAQGFVAKLISLNHSYVKYAYMLSAGVKIIGRPTTNYSPGYYVVNNT
jgi:hypothetical protein